MRKCLLLLTPALLLLAPAHASAQNFACTAPARVTSPFAFVRVNGLCTDLSGFIVQATKGWSLNTHVVLSGATIDLRALFNPDPGISFSATTLNPSSAEALTYSFVFGLPISPDVYTQAISSVNFSVSAPQGTTTVNNSAIQPTYITAYGSNGSTLTNLKVDAGTTPCVASGTLASNDCAAEGATNVFSPTFFDNLEAQISYTQDNTASLATFTGAITLDQVTTTPEPSSMVLLGIGLLAMAGGASARRRYGLRSATATPTRESAAP